MGLEMLALVLKRVGATLNCCMHGDMPYTQPEMVEFAEALRLALLKVRCGKVARNGPLLFRHQTSRQVFKRSLGVFLEQSLPDVPEVMQCWIRTMDDTLAQDQADGDSECSLMGSRMLLVLSRVVCKPAPDIRIYV